MDNQPGPTVSMGVGGHLNRCVPYPTDKARPRLADLPLPRSDDSQNDTNWVQPRAAATEPAIPFVYWMDATEFFKDCKTGAKVPSCVWLSK